MGRSISRVTLNVDSTVVASAKRYAKQHGISLSEIVERYLAAVTGPPAREQHATAPLLRSVRGSLKRAAPEDRKEHLRAKYR